MASFNWKKNIEDSLKDGLIITTGIFSALKAANLKPPKASLTQWISLNLLIAFVGEY